MRDDELRRRFRMMAEPTVRAADPPNPAAIRRRGRRRARRTAAATALTALLLLAGGIGVGTWSLAGDHRAGPAGHSPTTHAARPTPRTAPPAPSSGSAPAPGSAPSQSQGGIPGGPLPGGFKPSDYSFVSDRTGFALGTAPCAGAVRACTSSMAHTSDGGRTWAGGHSPRAWVGDGLACAQRPCVSKVRFANATVGWAFRPDLYVTRDGGRTWRQQPGPMVLALEAGQGTVVRVTGSPVGGGRLRLALDAAPVAGGAWQRLPTPPLTGVDATLVREGGSGRTYLLTDGGAGAAQALLASSDGARWRRLAPPCPAGARLAAVAAAPGGRVSVLCGSGAGALLALSQDGGTSWAAPRQPPSDGGGAVALADSGRALAVSEQDSSVRVSDDLGAHWRVASMPSGDELRGVDAGTIGFQDATTGRALSGDFRTIWTTVDGGRTWTRFVFPP